MIYDDYVANKPRYISPRHAESGRLPSHEDISPEYGARRWHYARPGFSIIAAATE